MKLNVRRSATEALAKYRSLSAPAAHAKYRDKLKAIIDIYKMDDFALDEGCMIDVRGTFPATYVIFPFDSGSNFVSYVGQTIDGDIVWTKPDRLTSGAQITKEHMIDELFREQKGLYFGDADDLLHKLADINQQEAQTIKGRSISRERLPLTILKSICKFATEDQIADMELQPVTDFDVDMSFLDIQKDFLSAMDSHISAFDNTQSASQQSQPAAQQQPQASTNQSLTVDQAIQQMRTTGGEMIVNGKRGLVVEIFYDASAGKHRARTNDGVNGLMNARFPKDKRQDRAVYVVPRHEVSLANKCYAISNSVPLDSYRVR
ncbi:MAG: hypothetical protein NC218_01345 [Acetobacter sp.]|nr:hypothetical protein [Acetobacter sp.]